MSQRGGALVLKTPGRAPGTAYPAQRSTLASTFASLGFFSPLIAFLFFTLKKAMIVE